MSGTASNQSTALEVARSQTRELLASSQTFKQLPLEEQKSMYLDMVNSLTRELSAGNGDRMVGAMIKPAGDLIDDQRHLNQRIEQSGELAGDFIREVNFPQFVKDLLKGVFDANLAVTLQQMEAYGNLLKTATASISKFVNQIDSTAAFGYLAENNSDDFSIDFSDDDEDKTPENPQGMVLVDKDGNKIASSRSDAEIDAEVKAKIMDAKIAMAKEHRALLRETLLMGVTRLVVEKGNVKAGVIFDFKATENIKKGDKAATQESRSSGGSVSASGGLLGTIFGGPRAGQSWSNKSSEISVASAKSQHDTSLAAKLTGSVDITFKSDYFKLDNFAAMYGPVTREGAPPPTPGAPGAPAPTAPAAR